MWGLFFPLFFYFVLSTSFSKIIKCIFLNSPRKRLKPWPSYRNHLRHLRWATHWASRWIQTDPVIRVTKGDVLRQSRNPTACKHLRTQPGFFSKSALGLELQAVRCVDVSTAYVSESDSRVIRKTLYTHTHTDVLHAVLIFSFCIFSYFLLLFFFPFAGWNVMLTEWGVNLTHVLVWLLRNHIPFSAPRPKRIKPRRRKQSVTSCNTICTVCTKAYAVH